MYNWSVDFFNDHSHCTTFQGLTSSLMNTNDGVIQSSAMGPASFVITASDLTTAGFDNKLKKYADDTYLICPSNSEVCAENELNKIEAWALVNNLKLNTKKSVEIVFVKPRSKAVKEIEELPIVKGINRVQSINILGIIISNNFGMKNHINAVVSNFSSSLFALRTLCFSWFSKPKFYQNCNTVRPPGGVSQLLQIVSASSLFSSDVSKTAIIILTI